MTNMNDWKKDFRRIYTEKNEIRDIVTGLDIIMFIGKVQADAIDACEEVANFHDRAHIDYDGKYGKAVADAYNAGHRKACEDIALSISKLKQQ